MEVVILPPGFLRFMGISQEEVMEKIILLLISVNFCLMGCASTQQKLDPLIYYKRDMQVEVNGFKGEGTLVVPKSNDYRIRAKFRGKGDLVTLKTCHREQEMEKLGWRETLNYVPNKGLEDDGKCYLELAAFEHKKGRHSWVLVDFESDLFKLPALIKCAGSTYNSRGVTICQSKEKLVQQIIFPEPVELSEKAKCYAKIEKPVSNIWEFHTPNRECTFIIRGKESGRFHKLTLIGYEKIIIREL